MKYLKKFNESENNHIEPTEENLIEIMDILQDIMDEYEIIESPEDPESYLNYHDVFLYNLYIEYSINQIVLDIGCAETEKNIKTLQTIKSKLQDEIIPRLNSMGYISKFASLRNKDVVKLFIKVI